MTQAVSWEAPSHEAPRLRREDSGSRRSPSRAPCSATHCASSSSLSSRHCTATQDTCHNRWVKFHKPVLASGVSAAKSRRWPDLGNNKLCLALPPVFQRGHWSSHQGAANPALRL